jgi:tetratricopeptide (TPR) repeat protein
LANLQAKLQCFWKGMSPMVRLQWIMTGLVLGSASFVLGFGGLQLSGFAQSEPSELPVDAELLKQTAAQRYTQAMLVGYAAADQGDYHTALINFRRALKARPGDRYARAAIRNMEAFIAQERAEAAKRAEIDRLEGTLARAVAANDWACAAASVDRLVELVPPTSTDRARLVAYRGELTGLIQSRDNLDQWSTICPGGRV